MKPFLLGLIIIFFGLGNMADSFILGLILLILGAGIAGGGIQTILSIEKAGTPYIISVPFFEKSKMHIVLDSIHEALAIDTDKTDLNLFFDKKPTT